MSSNDITKESYDRWRNLSVTKMFFKHLDDSIEATNEMWLNGSLTDLASLERTALLNQGATSNIQTLQQIRDLSWFDISGEAEEDE